MVDLISKKAMTYAGEKIPAGASFSASKKDAKVLVAIGKAQYQTRIMRPLPPARPVIQNPGQESGHKQKSSQMAAEETAKLQEGDITDVQASSKEDPVKDAAQEKKPRQKSEHEATSARGGGTAGQRQRRVRSTEE